MSRECSYANKLDPNIRRRIANERRSSCSTFAFDAKTSEKNNNNDNNNSRKHVRFKYQFPRFL